MRNKYTKEEFEAAVKTSGNVREILIKLNLNPIGGNYKTFYRNAKKFGTDVSAFINPTTYGLEKEKRDCITQEYLFKIIKNSTSYRQVLLSFGLTESGTNYKWLKTKITKFKLDIDHFLGQAHLKNKTNNWTKKIPLKDILIENSDYGSSHNLKKRLIKENIIKEECDRCKIYIWEDDKLSLHLDHINGNNTDNRIENLRLLCPNCHSLTETYCQKKKN